MKEFKQEVLSCVYENPYQTNPDYLDHLKLDLDKKRKLAVTMSELKRDGYLESKVGDEKLLEWHATEKGKEYLLDLRDQESALADPVLPYSQGFEDIKNPEPNYNPDDVAFKDEDQFFSPNGYEVINGYVISYDVLKDDLDIIRGSRSYDEAIKTAKLHGGGTIMEVKTKSYAKVIPVTSYEVSRV